MAEVTQETRMAMKRLGYTYMIPIEASEMQYKFLGGDGGSVIKYKGATNWVARLRPLRGDYVLFNDPISAAVWLNVELAGE